MTPMLKALLVAFFLMTFISCIRRIDPKLQAVLLPATEQNMTIFASGIPDSHKVCITTLRVQQPIDCVTFDRLKLFIRGFEKAKDGD